ncbi:putative efflux protein, MATE family [Tissierella praeacuta DSM 18095]|uniref:Multidrug export protein MepA n=1 Tax=Tissierella praeacuta DSM 18095 TaxID=1123404 RepID=A0A1M4YGI5_9FIRM|nr:MATE family efflux transporter [Tissierella praeacuta]TCU66429.1 putative MATE family efflux protein [Tissierella praeacuta]SHF04924.1 putative efflux protein, MATE family [Tissierella praeacuta DSM 18095]SUP02037.1 Staphylococcal virulence regulator protein A [Tissierella praeacuta]
MEMSREKNMILQDNMWKTCIKLSLPAVIAMVLYGLNTVFDAIFVGRYVGETAFAGVSIIYPLTQIPLGLGSLVGVGAGSYLSILIGEDNKDIQKRLIGNSNTLMIILTVLTMVLGFLFMNPLLKIMGASGEELIYGKNYYMITLIGSIFWIGGLAYNMIVRAEGKMKSAAIMMGIGMVVNIIANYILMAIFNFGVKGAAWGTNIAMLVYVLLYFNYCRKGKSSFETNESKFYFEKDIIKEIISLGVPSFIMTIMTVIQGVIILRALNNYGTTSDVAFYGMVFRILNLLMTPIYGLMRALQPAVGINYGARQVDRVIGFYKVFVFVAFILVLPVWSISMAAPNSILNLMLPDLTFSIQNLNYFRAIIAIVPLLCIVLTAMTFYPAIKKPKPAMLFGIGRQLFLYIPLMIILPKIFGVASIYYGSLAIDLGLALVIVVLLKKEFRILRRGYKW